MPVADELKPATPNFIRKLREVGFEVEQRKADAALERFVGRCLEGEARNALPGQT